ncbi:aa3-type cytochrome c oxidase subunit IV [Falsigemmobacter intermedius]|uniref:Aa3-type cytochrome c oxidase subunit IV n=1 Tax=Falsigemmobacter intermedius TaxID=1553448 RepID=A0A3S3UAE5_9RHOB|nr:aa3-type cytochrome c oxidase subunit IV [Falsigemmobacter intermedius]RWY42494.1 aa3-type cytochrome c oxidase subunit IV [Falsigemmobacter intermedius]
MAEHKHGSMDITVHQATYKGFIKFATWVGILSALTLVFLALANA